MRKLQFCLVVFALLALTCSGFAQVQNGQLTGTVSDPSGAAIANANVTVTNPATNFSSSTTSNAGGNYTVREIPVGTYRVTVEAAGFKTVTNTGVQVNAGTIGHVDAKMLVGQKTEIVEVTGALAQVNTEDSKLATTISSTQINNLPLNGRNVFDLMQLSAGAVNVQGVDFENGHNTVVNGVREDFNGFLINYVGITPIIATLGTLFGVRAIVTTWSGGLPVGPLPDRFTTLGQKTVGTVPVLLFYVVVIAVFAHVLLEYTPFGTTIRAVGANRDAARALGLNPRRASTLVYMLAGRFAALAGALQAAQLGAADPTLGTGLELQVIAAVVIGGISISGSIGTISGAVCGAILLSVLTTGLVLLHFQGDLQNLVVGVVIVLAAGIDQLRKKRMFRTSLAVKAVSG